MSMLDVHEDALNAGGALYHEFLLRFRKEHKIVYGIVEGKDDPLFYRGLIEQNLPAGWEVDFLIAGNKDKVFRAEKDFDWGRFDKGRICFFVDRDLSSFSEAKVEVLENLYITDSYSIENELANFGAVKRVMTELLNITNISPGELLLMRRSFDDNVKVFSGTMASIMAQIILWQKAGDRPSLDNILPKDLFEFEGGSIKVKEGFELEADRIKYVARKVNLAPSPMGEIEIATKRFLEKNGAEHFIRGKYVAWFVVEQCLHFHARIRDFCKSYTAPPKVRVTLGQGNAMALVANRIRCPASLEEFVKSTYCNFILEPKVALAPASDAEVRVSVWRKPREIAANFFERLFRLQRSS